MQEEASDGGHVLGMNRPDLLSRIDRVDLGYLDPDISCRMLPGDLVHHGALHLIEEGACNALHGKVNLSFGQLGQRVYPGLEVLLSSLQCEFVGCGKGSR